MSNSSSESVTYNPDGSKTITNMWNEPADGTSHPLWSGIKFVACSAILFGPFVSLYYHDVRDKIRHRKAIETIAQDKGVKIETTN